MLVLNAEQIRPLATMPALIECLRAAFAAEWVVPVRQVVSSPGGDGDRLLVSMPAFSPEGGGVVKLATVFPDNPAHGRPTVQAAILVFSDAGKPVALLDGTFVTLLRTGAASALASTYLSRTNSAHLVIIGTGALAPHMAAAHCAARPISRVSVCGRRRERARETASVIRSVVDSHVEVLVPESVEDTVGVADIVSCCTSSALPVLAGKWLRPGTFVDLVGSFSPTKREADDDVMRSSRVFVDTLQGTLSEAGDVIDPIERGVIDRNCIEGELADLVRGHVTGRRSDDEIIVFKAVGTAIEDLAAAQLIVSATSDGGVGQNAQGLAAMPDVIPHGF